MDEFESIIASAYSLGEINEAETVQRDAFARDLEMSVMHDNARGYL